MRPTVRSPGTLPISCGVGRVSMRYCSTAARCILSRCAKGSVSWSGNGRGAGHRWRWKMRTPTSLWREARHYSENPFIATRNTSKRAPPARFFSKYSASSRATNAGQARRSLVCVLPRGASSQQRFDITGLPLEVRTNHPARFQAYSSTRDDSSKAGDIVDWNEREFNALPPLATIIKVADPAPDVTTNTLPVTLTANANELGLLQVACVSADDRIRQSWPLEFDLRQQEPDSQSALQSGPASSASVQVKPNVSAARTRSRAGPHSVLVYSVPEATRGAHSGTAPQKPGADSGNAKERMERSSCPCPLARFGTLYGFA